MAARICGSSLHTTIASDRRIVISLRRSVLAADPGQPFTDLGDEPADAALHQAAVEQRFIWVEDHPPKRVASLKQVQVIHVIVVFFRPGFICAALAPLEERGG